MVKAILNNKYLVKKLVARDIKQKYKGSVLGMLWSWLVPVMMLIVYTFVFSEVFQAKWGSGTTDKYQFALSMFCGLSIFNVFAETMNRSVTLMICNTNYVKKVMFPLELLPFVVVVSSMFNCIISILILIVARFILYQTVSSFLLLLIPALIPVVIMAVGMGLFLSSLGVYLRDVGSVISVIVAVLMYATPVFYSLTNVPDKFRIIALANPLTYIIEDVRCIMIFDKTFEIGNYVLSFCIAVLFYVVGLIVFERSKEGFADVL